jgi:hypothetical protein
MSYMDALRQALTCVVEVEEFKELTVVRQKLSNLQDLWKGFKRGFKQGRVELDGKDCFDDVVNHRIKRLEAQYDQMTQDIITKEQQARDQGEDVDENTCHEERYERGEIAAQLLWLERLQHADHNDQADHHHLSNDTWEASGQKWGIWL